MRSKARLFLSQVNTNTTNPERNARTMIDLLKQIHAKDPDFVVFPEGFLSGYKCDETIKDRAESIPGPSSKLLTRLSKEYSCYITSGLFERRGKFLFNSAVMVGPREDIHVYQKTFLGPRETPYFKQGSSLAIIETRFGRIGLMICYDVFFPEVARALTLKGANCILCPSATAISAHEFELFLASRAAENRIYLAFANLVGWREELATAYFGSSRVIDPNGETLVKAKPYVPDTVFCDLDPSTLRKETRRRPLINDFKKQGRGVLNNILEASA